MNHYLVPWRFLPTGFLIAESTGMTSWEHGVLTVGEPGLRLPFPRRSNRTSGRRAGSRWTRRASVRRCAGAFFARVIEPAAFPRCSDAQLSSAVRSFCLDWKREGPVFIKVGGSLLPNRQEGRQGLVRCRGGIYSPH